MEMVEIIPNIYCLTQIHYHIYSLIKSAPVFNKYALHPMTLQIIHFRIDIQSTASL